jgi:hypothetical protein
VRLGVSERHWNSSDDLPTRPSVKAFWGSFIGICLTRRFRWTRIRLPLVICYIKIKLVGC